MTKSPSGNCAGASARAVEAPAAELRQPIDGRRQDEQTGQGDETGTRPARKTHGASVSRGHSGIASSTRWAGACLVVPSRAPVVFCLGNPWPTRSSAWSPLSAPLWPCSRRHRPPPARTSLPPSSRRSARRSSSRRRRSGGHLSMSADAWQAMQPRYTERAAADSAAAGSSARPEAATASRRGKASSSTTSTPRCRSTTGRSATWRCATRGTARTCAPAAAAATRSRSRSISTST